MMRLTRLLRRLGRDSKGAMVIETAIVAPTLVLMSLGAFETSRIVSRQMELQSAIAEAAQIGIAIKVDTSLERDTIKSIIRTSTGLAADKVTVSNVYRCGAATTTVTNENSCLSTDTITTYVNINVQDTYNPIWTSFGIGTPLNYNLTRRVIVA